MREPFAFIGGDYNHAPIRRVTDNFPDVSVLLTAPTRGGATIATNIKEYVENVEIRLPLTNEEGTPSDHNIIYMQAKIPSTDVFAWKYYFARPRLKTMPENLISG